MDTFIKSKIEKSCYIAEEFIKIYYENVDKRRHQLSHLYIDNGILTWNGNGFIGKDNIHNYCQTLPKSEHKIRTLDAQPILIDDDDNNNNNIKGNNSFQQKNILIQISGTVKFHNYTSQPFQQTIMITEQETKMNGSNKWKIISDCYRLQDYKFQTSININV